MIIEISYESTAWDWLGKQVGRPIKLNGSLIKLIYILI